MTRIPRIYWILGGIAATWLPLLAAASFLAALS